MWWVVTAFYGKPVNGLVCDRVNQFPPKIPELPPYISTTRAKNPYPAIDRPVNFSCCTRGMVVMYVEKVPNRCVWSGFYRKFGLKPRRFTTALSYNGKSDNQAKN
jgi:hypothetical protein